MQRNPSCCFVEQCDCCCRFGNGDYLSINDGNVKVVIEGVTENDSSVNGNYVTEYSDACSYGISSDLWAITVTLAPNSPTLSAYSVSVGFNRNPSGLVAGYFAVV